MYWVLEGKHDEWNQWAVEQVTWLHANGRMFEARTHIHTLLYEKRWAHRAQRRQRHHRARARPPLPGLVVVAGDVKDGHTHDEVDAWFRDTYLPDASAQSWGPEVVLDATTLPLLDERPADVPPPAAGPNRFLQLHFLDHDPEEGWADGYAKIGQAIEDSGLATHVWTGAVHPDRLRHRQGTPTSSGRRASVQRDDAVAGDSAVVQVEHAERRVRLHATLRG